MREVKVIRKSDHRLVASQCMVAEGPWERMKGLLGHSHLASGQGMWIEPCNNVHTFFMKFAIDVVYLNWEGQILRIIKKMEPWRTHLPVWSGRVALELPAGASDGLEVGDTLCLS